MGLTGSSWDDLTAILAGGQAAEGVPKEFLLRGYEFLDNVP